MKVKELIAEKEIEINDLYRLSSEINILKKEITNRIPNTTEITALSTYISQFYNGIENILKRIWKFNGDSLPYGSDWHIELFKKFCNPKMGRYPVIFDDTIVEDMAMYRKFRHYFFHGYGFKIEWERLKTGVEKFDGVYKQVILNIKQYLKEISN
jgi:hypothetical protein